MYPKGHTRRTICVDLIRSMRPQVLQLGLVTEEELERLFAEALAHLDDTATLVMPHLVFLVSGRKRNRVETVGKSRT